MLKTDVLDGLSVREAGTRLEHEKKRDGGERFSLFVPKKRSLFKCVTSFLLSPAILLLIFLSACAAYFGDRVTGVAVMLIALAGALICGFISSRARKSFDSTNEYASPTVRLRRGGNNFFTDGRNVVVGDLIVLSVGDLLPCDARIISSDSLVVKELIHTRRGIRNRIVKKDHETVYSADDAIQDPDAENMLYAGSAIIEGSALAIVVETGRRAYLAELSGGATLAPETFECEGIKLLAPTVHRVRFLCIAALALLSLVAIITLRKTSFIDNFLLMLSSVAMVSLEISRLISSNAIALSVERTLKVRRKKRDNCASIRDMRTVDALTEVNDLLLLGKAALSDGVYHVGDTYTADGILSQLTPDTDSGNRILNCMYTYLQALGESGIQNEFVLNGLPEALSAHLKTVGFDESGASLIIKSLYFANDAKGENGYACIESTMSEYRVALTFDPSILSVCKYMRCSDARGKVDFEEKKSSLGAFIRESELGTGRCMYVVSECDGVAVLEGVIRLAENAPAELQFAKKQFDMLGVKTTVLLLDEDDEARSLVSSKGLEELFCGKIAYASEFKREGLDVSHALGEYCAYIGFSADEYSSLIAAMKEKGSSVAAYGIDNRYYDVMARADLAISCDTLRYNSSKHRDAVYEKNIPEGRDSNVRCSQMTRFLSKIIVHRTHQNGGGLGAVAHAIVSARGAYVSLAHSILFFAMTMSTLLPIVITSVLFGAYLLNAVQAVAISTVCTVLAVTAFADIPPRQDLVYAKINLSRYPIALLGSKLPSMISRISVAVLMAVVLKILAVTHVFGEATSYEMPVYICILFALFAEVFLILMEGFKKGEGRSRCWFKLILAYSLLLGVGALITQSIFISQMLVNKIGVFEFVTVPAYVILYLVAVVISRYIESGRKKV